MSRKARRPLRRLVLSQIAREPQRWPELRRRGAQLGEPGSLVEDQRPRMGGDEEPGVPGLTGLVRRVVDERAADAVPHRAGLDEEVVELGAILDRAPGREPEQLSVAIDGDANAAGLDRFPVNTKDLRVGIEARSVLVPDMRRTTMDVAQRVNLIAAGEADA